MSRNLPFPPKLVEMSAHSAAVSRVTSAGRQPRVGEETRIPGVAAWRKDGVVRLAYDLYRPEYPAGAEPGLATCVSACRAYPNDTTGQESRAEGFVPADEILTGAGPYDTLAMAWWRNGAMSGLIAAISEDQMAVLLAHAPEGTEIRRGVVRLGEGVPVVAAFSGSVGGGNEFFAAESADALAAMIGQRFPFLEGRGEALLAAFEAHAEKHGHIARRIVLPDVRPDLGVGPEAIALGPAVGLWNVPVGDLLVPEVLPSHLLDAAWEDAEMGFSP